jgi:hypothetical protein
VTSRNIPKKAADDAQGSNSRNIPGGAKIVGEWYTSTMDTATIILLGILPQLLLVAAKAWVTA